MLETLDEETGWTGMAGIACTGCLNVIDRLRRCANPASKGVATGTIFGGVLEYAIDMALLAPQGSMHIPEQEPCLCMIEWSGAGCSLRRWLGRSSECQSEHQAGKQRCRYLSDSAPGRIHSGCVHLGLSIPVICLTARIRSNAN